MSNVRIIANNIADSATLTCTTTQNLLLRSQEFDNIAWAGTATHTANSAAAPDGTTTADTISDSSILLLQNKNQTVAIANDSESYTFSVMVKMPAGVSPPAQPYIAIVLSLLGGTTTVSRGIVLAIHNGSFMSIGIGTSGVKYEGGTPNVYYNLYVTVPNNSTGNTSALVEIYPAYSAAGAATPNVSDVLPTDDKIVWGASLTKSSTLNGYVPTTTAAASGGNFVPTLPVTNLQLEGKSRVARTTDSYGDKVINGTLSAPEILSSLVLNNHNLGGGTTFNLFLYSGANQTGSVLYDSGQLLPTFTIAWQSWGVGSLAMPKFALLWFAEVAGVLSFRLVIQARPDVSSYIQIKRLVLGRYFSPAVNAALGMSLAWNDSSVQRRTQGGSIRTETRALYRSLSGVLDCLTETERYQFLDAVRAAGMRKEIFISAFPTVGGIKERDFSMLGKFTRLPAINVVQATTYSSGFEIEEV